MYQITDDGTIVRLQDRACIPPVAGNPDYEAYQAWIGAGNVALVPPPPDPKDLIRAQIEAIERATGVVRVVREGMMEFAELEAERKAEKLTAQGTPTTAAEILAGNVGYMRTKAVDDHIKQLRGMLA